MPIIIDKRVKKRDGVSRYRVIHNYTDVKGKHKKVERLVWGRAEAQLVEMQLANEYGNKKVVPSRMTIGELYEQYDEYHAIDTKKASHNTMMKRLRIWVLPYFQDRRLDKLTQQDLANWKVEINKSHLALVSKQNVYCAFVAMLNYAVKLDIIPKNNLSVLGNFKDNAVLSKPPEPIHYYTSEQFEKFISEARKTAKSIMDWDFYTFFCIAYFTGCRKGEIHALKWSDIKGNTLQIRRSISQKLEGISDLETGTKNKSSMRDLQLPEPLIEVLNEHKARYKDWAKERFSEDKRICGFDKPLRDTSIDNRNRKYAKAAGLPRIKIHDFRHSHASLLANEGINIQEVARRLGHSNVQETWNTYAHLYPREEERAIDVLNTVGIGLK